MISNSSSCANIRRMIVSPVTVSEIEAALGAYGDAVLASDLSATSQGIYLVHATNFVRWIKGEFQPGAYKNPYALRKKDIVVHGFNLSSSRILKP